MNPMSIPLEPPTTPRARSSEVTSIATLRLPLKRARLRAAHAGALGRGSVLLPYQLVPNEFGLWQSVGFDSLLGGAFLGLHVLRRRKGTSRKRELPPTPQVGKRALITTIGALAVAYRWSGYVAALVDGFVYRATPTATPAMGRALQVLGGHLAWLVVGVSVLAVVPALEFGEGRVRWNREKATAWYRFKWKTDWLWWVAGGYCASALIFNVADGLNHFLVPPTLFDDDTLVTKMVNPDEGRGVASILVGGVAPCVTAPWWEEVLYRGFLLPALLRFLPFRAALPLSAVLFAAHHNTAPAMLPLTALGLLWATLYIRSANLLVVILIHAMWNSRVFLL